MSRKHELAKHQEAKPASGPTATTRARNRWFSEAI